MPEVETTEVAESPDAPATEPIEATQPTEDVTTWKARLAGKDRALTAAKAEQEKLKADLEALSRWKAEKEQSEMTEVDRLNLRIQELETAAASAQAEAKRLALRSEFPLATAFIGEDALTALPEPRLAEIEERLKAKSEPAEPPVNPNNPPRVPRTGTPIASKPGKSDEELIAELATFGNPFLDLQ